MMIRPKMHTLIAAAMLLMTVSCGIKNEYIVLRGYAQGGVYAVKINTKGVSVEPKAIQASVDSILREIDTTLSGYNPKSILSRYNRGEKITVTPMFREIYEISKSYYEETGGALDVAAAPLYDAWGFGFSKDSLPSDAQVKGLMESCGMDMMPDSLGGESVGKLNYNAIAQGYSCDLVAAYLYSIGVKDMLVDIGEIYCDGLNPERKPWTIAVDRPTDGNETPGADVVGTWHSNGGPCGIVTSGNYRKFYVRDGKKYAHTIDPRTGYPVSHNLLSATIVARDATTADAYATYCMVIGLDEAREFIQKRPDIEGYLVYDDNGTMRSWTSEGF